MLSIGSSAQPLRISSFTSPADPTFGCEGQLQDSPKLGKVEWIVVHHSVTPATYIADDIDRIHGNRGFHWRLGERTGHTGYHWLALADGSIAAGRPEELVGSHVGPKRFGADYYPGLNSRSIGICFVGDFTSHGWTPEQATGGMDELERLCRAHQVDAEHVIGHREYEGAATECPGKAISMVAIRVELAHRLKGNM